MPMTRGVVSYLVHIGARALASYCPARIQSTLVIVWLPWQIIRSPSHRVTTAFRSLNTLDP